MTSYLRISVRFLDASYHGRKDGGEPEWPPSPLRLFQSLVAASAAKFSENVDERVSPALRWLERQPPSRIITPPVTVGAPYRLSVPNNAMDIVARAWVRGNTSGEGDANPATHKAMKTVRPIRMTEDPVVHFLWSLPESPNDESLGCLETLCGVARSIVALGWGVDLVAVEGRVVSESELHTLHGEEWFPVNNSINRLRVPVAGTLADLTHRHNLFLNRIPADGRLRPVPPLSTFAIVGYRRSIDPAPRAFAAFQMLKPDASAFRAFNAAREMRRVVGMLRNATAQAARIAGWDEATISSRLLGHGESRGDKHQPVQTGRFAYLPVPSIESRGPGKACVVGPIRRVLIASLDEFGAAQIPWARRLLSGGELIDEASGSVTAILSLTPNTDPVLRRYAPQRGASVWASVTPVVLPGYDDRRQSKCDELLRKAIRQAGYSDALANYAEIEWRKVGFLPGVDLATAYRVPDYLRNFPCYHVRIAWKDAKGQPVRIGGPLCLGGGRFLGLGLFVAADA